ncbi:hypothetical protein K9M74_05385 [Candidatus Woesearchaeota archaeon]|nr:hypothetical protein [Candidatus Woesearchaeota archaeon]
MKIGFDLDGVLAEFTESYLQYYNDKHGTEHTSEEFEHTHFSKHLQMTHTEVERSIAHFFQSPFAKAILPVKGAQDVLHKLVNQHELHVITSRPKEVSKITLDWLNDFFPDMFTSIHFSGDWVLQPDSHRKKADFCLDLGIDILIEDYLPYAEECASCVKHIVFLFDRPWNHDPITKSNVVRVKSWIEIQTFIETI